MSQFLIIHHVFADDDAGVFNGSSVTSTKLKNGDISFSDIPGMIKVVTEFLLGFSASIAMIMLIVGALQYSLASIDQNKKKAMDTIQMSITGFVVSVSAWFIIRTVIGNL